jgi:putative tricarboxylic transport membrane protein
MSLIAHRDAVAGFLLLALSFFYHLGTRAIPVSSLSDDVGPGGLPNVLTAALVLLAAILVFKGMAQARLARGRTVAAEPAASDDDEQGHASLPRALGFVAVGVGYMIIAPWIGYAAGIALLILGTALYEREKPSLKLVAVAAGGGIAFWLVFVRLLGVEQPFSRLLALVS